MTTVTGARLDLQALAVDLNIPALLERRPRGNNAAAPLPTPPAVNVALPDVSPALGVDFKGLSILGLLEHARAGTATLRLPFVPRSASLGPLKLDIPAGTCLVAQLNVQDGKIQSQGTQVSVEPPLQLPLGRVLHGIYVDDTGALMVHLQGLPDLNLSLLLLGGFTLPATVAQLLALLPRDKDEGPKGSPRAPVVDLDGLSVDARGLTLDGRPLQVGPNVRVIPGPGTRLDIRWDGGVLGIQGTLEVQDASIQGRGFSLRQVQGRAGVTLNIPLGGPGNVLVKLQDLTTRAESLTIHAPDVDLEVYALSVSRGTVVLDPSTTGGWRVDLPQTNGLLQQGTLGMRLGAQAMKLNVAQVNVGGMVRLSPGNTQLDLAVDGGRVRTNAANLDLGVAQLHVEEASCEARGRLVVAGNQVDFDGAFTADAAVAQGQVQLGSAQASLDAGTRLTVVLEGLSLARGTPTRMSGRAFAALQLREGSVPVLAGAPLVLSRGADAQLTLHRFTWGGPGTFPELAGRARMHARSDAWELHPALLSLPDGALTLQVEQFATTAAGHLRLDGVVLHLEA